MCTEKEYKFTDLFKRVNWKILNLSIELVNLKMLNLCGGETLFPV